MPYESYTLGCGIVLGPQYGDNREFVTAADCEASGVKIAINTRKRDDGSSETLVSVHNNSGRELSEVIFPDLDLEPKGSQSGFTMPVGPGWWQPFEPLDEGEHINWNYPVYGAMQWVDYCDEDSGFYVGVHDKIPYIKIFTVGKRSGRPWMRVRFTDIRLLPGETFDLPPVVFHEHQGGWHEGAKLYRAWAESWMEKPSGAEWYDEAPAWSWLGMKDQHASKPARLFSNVSDEAVTRARYGIEVTNLASWIEHGHDTHYPDYIAGNCMGGEAGLIEAVDAVHAEGLRICLYTNGRIVDPEGSISGNSDWINWACQAPSSESLAPMQRLHANFALSVDTTVGWNTAGRAAIERYGRVDFAVMCPGSTRWRELFLQRMEYLAKTYKVDGSFIDQVCGCWAYPCYSDGHDHRRPNESWSGYLPLLKDLRRALRSINPEFLMSTEGVCDVLGQFFDLQQGHNDWDTQVGTKSRPMPELYSYTFPWYLVNTGYASHNNYYHLKLAHAVGSGLDVCSIEPDKLEDQFLRLLAQIMVWRKDYAHTLRGGEFLGALRCDNPHYLAHAFEKDGRIVVTAAWVPYKCDPERPETVRLTLRNRIVKNLRLLTEDGERTVTVSANGPDSSLCLPFSEIAVLEVSFRVLS